MLRSEILILTPICRWRGIYLIFESSSPFESTYYAYRSILSSFQAALAGPEQRWIRSKAPEIRRFLLGHKMNSLMSPSILKYTGFRPSEIYCSLSLGLTNESPAASYERKGNKHNPQRASDERTKQRPRGRRHTTPRGLFHATFSVVTWENWADLPHHARNASLKSLKLSLVRSIPSFLLVHIFHECYPMMMIRKSEANATSSDQ